MPLPGAKLSGHRIDIMQTPEIGIHGIIAIALASLACGQAMSSADPGGILRQPIPDKLVVLTFDDACASGYTVAAPVLKALGFGATFYVCDFDSFKTRKDWYLTYRQMKTLHDEGFEIGNHTVGHGGGLANFLAMEDQLLAHDVPKPTTVCWPVYSVVWDICPELAKNGYTFGRGGHDCPYRPTTDHPFDVPSFTLNNSITLEAFTKIVRRAVNGKLVVLTYHGVPDMEHPGVSVKPETFKAMMQYLKDNAYHVVAMRDLTVWIDPAKAARLPHNSGGFKEPEPIALAAEDKPYLAPPAKDRQDGDVPKQPAAGVTKPPLSAAKDILSFVMPGASPTTLGGPRIGVYVPESAEVKSLTPTFTLSPLATASPPSGTTRDFTTPQSYTITAQDGSSRTVGVKVVRCTRQDSFVWNKADNGNWSDAAKWADPHGAHPAPAPAGQADYVMSFDQPGTYAVTHDLHEGFQLNQLNLRGGSAGLTLAGHGIKFVRNPATGFPPALNVARNQGITHLGTPLTLADDLNVNMSLDQDANVYLTLSGMITGSGALVLNSHATDYPSFNNHDAHYGILKITQPNTYHGGTLVNGGKIILANPAGLGTGPVAIRGFGTIQDSGGSANALTIDSGYLYSCTWNGPLTLNGTCCCYGDCKINAGMSGPGGLIMLGTPGTYLNMTPGGTLVLGGSNHYTGPTTVFPGTLIVKKATGLYHGDPAQWTPANITIHTAATLRLDVGGEGEFTGAMLGTLLGNLTRAVRDNGLMGGSFLCLDTSNSREPVVLATSITDSTGPGGGPFVIRKCGAGTLRLAGINTYTGQTVLEGGTLSIDSFNSHATGKRRPSSSLGAPPDIETGEIVIGEAANDGACALVYSGPGETTDRVINLAGKEQTVTINQSGGGLLKFTSAFVISGYGANKTIALTGDTAGSAELAGAIANPHDRAGKAVTSITKSGTGTWTLSGPNTHSGPTRVTGGTLSLTHSRSLGDQTEVDISAGARLDLNFKGQMKIRTLCINGKEQAAGIHGAADLPTFIKGTGVLVVGP